MRDSWVSLVGEGPAIGFGSGDEARFERAEGRASLADEIGVSPGGNDLGEAGDAARVFGALSPNWTMAKKARRMMRWLRGRSPPAPEEFSNRASAA